MSGPLNLNCLSSWRLRLIFHNSSERHRKEGTPALRLPVWSLSVFSSSLLRMCVSWRSPPSGGVYAVHPTQWLQCSRVCVSACGCMTMALNPVTGWRMISTEIAAKPVAPPLLRGVCYHPKRGQRAHAHTGRHTSFSRVLQDGRWRRTAPCLDSASLFVPHGASHTCI